MLNATSSMAYSATNLPSRTNQFNGTMNSNRTYLSSRLRPPSTTMATTTMATMTAFDHHGGLDYYASVSSADFGYDLFLHGVCDSTTLSSSSSSHLNATNTNNNSRFFSRRRLHHQQQQQQNSSTRTNLFSSISSLNRSSFHESTGTHHASYLFQTEPKLSQQSNTITASHQQRMALFASNLSLGSSTNSDVPDKSVSARQRTRIKNEKIMADNLESDADNIDFLSHQQLHALHRFRRQRKKGFLNRLRDVVISFTPKARISILNQDDIYVRFGKLERDTLACFDFLDNISIDDRENVTKIDDEINIEDILRDWLDSIVVSESKQVDNQLSCDRSSISNKFDEKNGKFTVESEKKDNNELESLQLDKGNQSKTMEREETAKTAKREIVDTNESVQNSSSNSNKFRSKKWKQKSKSKHGKSSNR